MQSVDARIASYAAITKPKTRARPAFPLPSATHPALTPANLARAGFYYDPESSSSDADVDDTCQCFVCGAKLGGWEEADDPFEEHMRRGACAWANTVCWATVQRRKAEERGEEWILEPEGEEELPRGSTMTENRAITFGQWWPHKAKRGWKPTVANLAAAGFVYAGTDADTDLVECPLCNYAVHGWEANDDPMQKHEKRNPDCRFFTTELAAGPSRPKAGNKRGPKGKTPGSQSSRAETAVKKTEPEPAIDLVSQSEEDEAESQPAPKGRRGRPPKAKAAAPKPRAKRGARKAVESEASDLESVNAAELGSELQADEPPTGPKVEQTEQNSEPPQQVTPRPMSPPKARKAGTRGRKATKAMDVREDDDVPEEVEPPSSQPILSPATQPSRLTSRPARNTGAAKSVDPPTPLSQLDRLINIPPSSPAATPRAVEAVKALTKPVVRPSPSRLPREVLEKGVIVGAMAVREVMENLVNSPKLARPDSTQPPEMKEEDTFVSLTEEQKDMTLEELVRSEMRRRYEEMRRKGEEKIAKWEETSREARRRFEAI